MDGEVGELLAQRSNKDSSRFRLQDTGHVLDGQDVDSTVDELLGKVEVVLEVVLGVALGVGNISRVANSGLDNSSCLLGCIDTESHVLNVVEGIKHSENVESILNCLGRELAVKVYHQP